MLVITLLSLTMLVGLFFYVYNIGNSVNRRLELQSAADATAISGATWMARSMNVIAMNNVAEARLICLACVLDSLPLAAEMTIAEENLNPQASQFSNPTLTTGLRAQLQRGIPNTQIERGDFLRKGLQKLYDDMVNSQSLQNTHLDALTQIDNALNSVEERKPEGGAMDVEPVTHWNGGSGKIWQAIIALDELSQATVESAGVLAQADAQRFGKANNAQVAMLAPLLPRLPARRGSFSDFGPVLMDSVVEVNAPNLVPPRERHDVQRSNLVGRLQGARDFLVAAESASVQGGAIPDYAYPQRLGPWARLFTWRNGVWFGGMASPNWTLTGVSEYDMGSTSGSTGVGGQLIGYSTYGPMEWARQMVRSVVGLVGVQQGSIDSSRFEKHLMRIATVKLGYVFGVDSPRDIQYAQDWITDYAQAKQFVQTQANLRKILRTQYYYVTVKSVRKWDDPLWLQIPLPAEYFQSDPQGLHSVGQPQQVGDAALWVWQGRNLNGWYDIESYLQSRTRNLPRVLRTRTYTVPGTGVNGVPPQYTPPLPAKKLVAAEWERPSDYVWRLRQTFEVDEDSDLRQGPNQKLDLVQNADGSPKYYTIYTVSWYVFRGCEVRNPVTVYTPGNWGGEPLPAPMLLDTSQGDYDAGTFDAMGNFARLPDCDSGARRDSFTFLGVSRRDLSSTLWPSKFSQTVKGQSMAIAQAKVFNNRSWDLWTQDWQAQLTPGTKWDDWRARLENGKADLGQINNLVDGQDVQAVEDFLLGMPQSGMDYVKH